MGAAGTTWKWSEESRARLSEAHKNLSPEATAARLIKIAHARTFMTAESNRKTGDGVRAYHAPLKQARRDAAMSQQEFKCAGCKKTLPRSDFREKKTVIHVRPVDSRCRPCDSARVKNLPKDPVKLAAARFRDGRLPARRYSFLKASAIARDLSLDITLDQYKQIIQDAACEYCESEIESGSGLDRINCALGYSLDNVVPACGVCNLTRADIFTFEQMKVMGALIKGWRADGSLKTPSRLIAGKPHKAALESR